MQKSAGQKFARSGASFVSVHGVNGPNCKELTASLEGFIGTVTDVAPTADWYHSTNAETGEVCHLSG